MSKLKIFSVELSFVSGEEECATCLKKLEEDVMAFCTTENIPMTKTHITWLQDSFMSTDMGITRLTAIVSTDS